MIDEAIYLDSSFVIAVLIKSHPFYSEATSVLVRCGNHPLYVSLLCLDEVIHNLSKYNLSREEIVKSLEKTFLIVRTVEVVGYPPHLDTASEYLQLWQKTGLQPRDTLHLLFMKVNGIRLLATFDRDFIANQAKLGIHTISVSGQLTL